MVASALPSAVSKLALLAVCLGLITACASTTDAVSGALVVDDASQSAETANPVSPPDSTAADESGVESNTDGSATTDTTQAGTTSSPGEAEPADRLTVALACLNDFGPSDLNGIKGCVSDRSDVDEAELDADVLRASCQELGGEACVDLLFASSNDDDWLVALSCGGRGTIPCPEDEMVASDPVDDDELDDGFGGGSLAGELDALIRGTVVQYFFRDVNRPIYGWVDETVIEYCTDGSFGMRSQGERRTVLDNTEYRSDAGSGTWNVTLVDESAALVEHYYNDGRVRQLPVSGSIPNHVLPPGVTARTIGAASC